MRSVPIRQATPTPVPKREEREQRSTRQDGRDAQTHEWIALSIKLVIIPHIRACKKTMDAWGTLTTLCQARNETRVAYL